MRESPFSLAEKSKKAGALALAFRKVDSQTIQCKLTGVRSFCTTAP
jgi:hypothetical protein